MGSSGDYFAEEDSDASDTEKLGFKVGALAALMEGKIAVQNPDWTTYACPFCPKRKKQDYLHKDLLQHAAGVGSSGSNKRSTKEKGEHSALAKYLRRNPPPETFLKEQPLEAPLRLNETDWRSKLPSGDLSERIVWPWIGVVVNIPTRVGPDGRYAGESGSKLRDELAQRGFNPTRVRPLWNFRGHSGMAAVEFTKGWPGLSNGLSFERAYEADGHGKKDWAATKEEERSGLYAWLARGDDYQLPNIVGEHLRKIGDLKTISEIMEEEAMKQDRLVSDLTNTIDEKNRHMEEIQLKHYETSKSIDSLIDANKKLTDKYDQDIKKLQSSSLDHYLRVFSGFEKLKSQLESQKRELELRGDDLEKREAFNDVERKKLAEDIAENIENKSSLEMASLAQSHADERVLKLAEDQERQKQELHNKILSLREQLDKRQVIELEIEQLKGKLNMTKQMAMGDDDLEILGKVEEIHRQLREKEVDLDHVESMNQTLITKERTCNDELQEARKELIAGLKDMRQGGSIGVKRLGELDPGPFIALMKRKYSEDEAEDRANDLCSVWEEHLKDPDWHPFMRFTVGNKETEIINPDDEKLSDLKKELGVEVYKSVTNCLIEINEHNPSGRYITSELWNYKERKRAPLKDGIEVLLSHWREKKARFEGE